MNAPKFSREQLLLVVEAILCSALDRIESGQPTSGVTWEDRLELVNKVNTHAGKLGSYERGAMEMAGMALAVLFANLTDDGIGIYDALHCADAFEKAVEAWVELTWSDHGAAVRQRMNELGEGGWQIKQAYTNYPDAKHHAEAFVNELFSDYLA